MAKRKAVAKRKTVAKEPPTPKLEGVSSSAIRAVGHDGKSRLDVEFRSGAKYRYHGVSKRSATSLKKAESVGRHFVRNVRNAYAWTKLRGSASVKGKSRKGKR